MLSWWAFLIAAVVLIGIVIAVIRSLNRWQQPPPGSPLEAQQAEARLWSTKTGGGGSAG